MGVSFIVRKAERAGGSGGEGRSKVRSKRGREGESEECSFCAYASGSNLSTCARRAESMWFQCVSLGAGAMKHGDGEDREEVLVHVFRVRAAKVV